MEDYEPWLWTVAAGMLHRGHADLDDLVQEGRIAMWHARRTHKPELGPLDWYLKMRARNVMLTAIERGRWTGQPDRQNGGHGGSRPDRPLVSLDGLSPAAAAAAEPADPRASLDIEDAELAAHAKELAGALTGLREREREYVSLRFWAGARQGELDRHFGTHSPNIWKTARPKLRDGLAHLRSAA